MQKALLSILIVFSCVSFSQNKERKEKEKLNDSSKAQKVSEKQDIAFHKLMKALLKEVRVEKEANAKGSKNTTHIDLWDIPVEKENSTIIITIEPNFVLSNLDSAMAADDTSKFSFDISGTITVGPSRLPSFLRKKETGDLDKYAGLPGSDTTGTSAYASDSALKASIT